MIPVTYTPAEVKLLSLLADQAERSCKPVYISGVAHSAESVRHILACLKEQAQLEQHHDPQHL